MNPEMNLNKSQLATLSGRSYDVAVIGGGINGTATARALSSAGYHVILVEQNDFGSGSSSRSTRLMHCGLNYIAMAHDARRFREKLHSLSLAGKMMRERAHLSRELRHRFMPRTVYVPIRNSDVVRAWQFDLAFAILRSSGGYSVPLNYRRLKRSELDRHPLAGFLGDDLVGLVSYTELTFNWPERVCVDYALASAESGATVLNYTALSHVRKQGARWALTLRDNLTGIHADINCRAIVNMAGVWSNEVNKFNSSMATPTVTSNKGCHLAVSLPQAFNGVGVVARNSIGHMFVCLPWKHFHIIGPTEMVHEGTAEPHVLEADIEAILSEAKQVMPGAEIGRENVLFHWAGLRPATFEEGNPLGDWNRKIYADDANDGTCWLSMSWGRLADHAITSKDVVALIGKKLGTPLTRSRATGLFPKERSQRVSLEPDLEYAINNEGPSSVADVMFGRTGWGWDTDLGSSKVTEVATALARRSPHKDPKTFAAEYEEYVQNNFRPRSAVRGPTL